MRTRIVVAWACQIALALGLFVAIGAGLGSGATDWSSILLLGLLLGAGIAIWLRLGFGLLLIAIDLLYALLGLGIVAVGAPPTDPTAVARAIAGSMWLFGGLLGAVALIASTRATGSPGDDIDTTAY